MERHGRALGLVSAAIYGGVPIQQQTRHLHNQMRERPVIARSANATDQAEGLDVVVATPGRLIDILGIRGNPNRVYPPFEYGTSNCA